MSDEVKNTFSTYLGPDFQQKLVWQLLVEPDFAKNVIENISVEYFDDQYIQRLFIIMLEYFKEHDKVPNLQNGSIEEAIHKYKSPTSEVEGTILFEKLDQIRLWNERVINKNLLYDGDVVRKETLVFIKQQEYRKVAEYVMSKVKSGEIRKPTFNFEIEEMINKIYHIGDEEDYGTDVIDNIEDALSKEFRQTIPTGIEVVDAVTGNGLGKGEIGLILAPSGIGKTTMLTKIANTAFENGKKVLQIIFEDTIPQVQRKHFAIWSDIKLSDIDDNVDEVRTRVVSHVQKVKDKGGKIDIVRFADQETTIHDIQNWIARQEKKFGYKYDLIVLDYLDCLEPNRRERDLQAAELSIIKSFIAMAAEYNIPCWGAIQTNRSGFNIDFVEAHHTGGNIKRVQKSHFVMSIAKPDKTASLANLKIIKARFARDGYEFPDCVFDNDTLEIRITNKKYLNGIKVTKLKEDANDKLEEKALKLTDGAIHSKLSEFHEGSETISDAAPLLKVKEGVQDFDKKIETINDVINKNEGASEGVNDGANNNQQTISEKITDDDLMSFLNQCNIENSEKSSNDVENYLNEMRENQGAIWNEE